MVCFAIPASFTDRFKTEHEKVNPATVLLEEGSSGDVTFHLPACTHALLSLNDIYMEMEVAIKCREGAGEWRMITAADGVALVNDFAFSYPKPYYRNGRSNSDRLVKLLRLPGVSTNAAYA